MTGLYSKLYSKCNINSGMHQYFILIHLFFPTLFVSLMFCVRLLSELMILLATHCATIHLTCRKKLRKSISCNLILETWKCYTRNIRNWNSASNYIFRPWKLFYIYKLIHIDLKPRILIASFLWTPSLNN